MKTLVKIFDEEEDREEVLTGNFSAHDMFDCLFVLMWLWNCGVV